MKENSSRKGRLIFVMVLLLFLPILVFATEVTEQDLRDAILSKRVFTQEELAAMDLNTDGKVDVADLIRIRLGIEAPASLVGEHIGVMYRDGGDIISGVTGVSNSFPLQLTITSETPELAGIIDNGSDSEENPIGAHYSLYFPKGRHEVQFQTAKGAMMNFVVKCKNPGPPLVGGALLTRTVTFTGDFTDPQKRNVLSGTYTDVISGVEGAGSITLSGKFQLYFGS